MRRFDEAIAARSAPPGWGSPSRATLIAGIIAWSFSDSAPAERRRSYHPDGRKPLGGILLVPRVFDVKPTSSCPRHFRRYGAT